MNNCDLQHPSFPISMPSPVAHYVGCQVCVDTNDAICLDIAEKDGMKLTNMIEFLLLELEQCEIGERDLEKNQKDDILSEDARVHIENMESQTSKLEKTIKELDILIEKTREKIVSEGSLLATLKQTADTEVGHNTALFNTKRKLTDRIRRLVESDDSLEQQRENLRNAVTTSERANEISKSKVRARMEVKTRTMATYRKVKAYSDELDRKHSEALRTFSEDEDQYKLRNSWLRQLEAENIWLSTLLGRDSGTRCRMSCGCRCICKDSCDDILDQYKVTNSTLFDEVSRSVNALRDEYV